MGKRPDIVWEEQCWNNRKVILYRHTLLGHIARFHIDEIFVTYALRRNLRQPICVLDNRKHGTVNAIYDLPNGGHKWLLVAICFPGLHKKIVGKTNFIKTFYGVNEIPGGRVLWGKKP